MTGLDLYNEVKDHIPSEYLYISKNLYTVKGLPFYTIYYNSRIPNSKLSPSAINYQNISTTTAFSNSKMKIIENSKPILLQNYTREIRTNSIIQYIDLAGDYMSDPNSLDLKFE